MEDQIHSYFLISHPCPAGDGPDGSTNVVEFMLNKYIFCVRLNLLCFLKIPKLTLFKFTLQKSLAMLSSPGPLSVK
jgi:hypothetical protein